MWGRTGGLQVFALGLSNDGGLGKLSLGTLSVDRWAVVG